MKCKNCGARIKGSELRCPYCAYMNEQAADRRYMGKLHEIHTGMEELSNQPKKTLKHEILLMMLIALAGICFAIAVGFVWDYVTWGNSAMEIKQMDRHAEKKFAWMDEYFPVLDSLYEEGNYQELQELYHDRYDLPEEYFYEWEHAGLLEAMEQYEHVKELERRVSEGETIYAYDVTYALEGGLKLLYEYGMENGSQKFTEKDAEAITGMGEEAKLILENCLGIHPEATEDLYLSFCEGDYFSYSICRDYSEKLYEELFAEREGDE